MFYLKSDSIFIFQKLWGSRDMIKQLGFTREILKKELIRLFFISFHFSPTKLIAREKNAYFSVYLSS